MSLIFFIAISIFVLSYLIIISEKIHRTVVALTGAVLMILFGVINQHQAIEGIDFNTIGLLIGMMVVVGIARQSGIFQAIALWVAKFGKGDPKRIFIYLGLTIALFSALLDNVTTVLLMVPVTFIITNNLKVSPYPYLAGTILLSNIGGAATLIGDPPNILIGSAANLSFNQFLFHLGPVSLVLTGIVISLLVYWFKKDLQTTDEAKESILKFDPKQAITDWALLKKSLFALGIILLGFLTHGITHIEGATIALGGAALLLLLTALDPDDHLSDVEWTTIFFFVGLFVLVTGIEHIGVIDYLAEYLLSATGTNVASLSISILWGSAFLSAVVDNIPFVAAMIPLIEHIGTTTNIPLDTLWWALALGADIGGNATLVGASANLVVAGISEKEGERISFIKYMKLALPLTILCLIICTGYLYLRYL